MTPDDTIQSFTLDQDEGRAFIQIECDDADHTFWLNDIEAMRGLIQAGDELRSYVGEHDRAKAAYQASGGLRAVDDRDAHPLDSPKHPDYLERMIAITESHMELNGIGQKGSDAA